MFQPNLNSSRDSYRLYFQSLSRQKIVTKRNENSNKKIVEKEPKSSKKSFYNEKKDSDSIDMKTIRFFIELFYPDPDNGTQILSGLNSVKQK